MGWQICRAWSVVMRLMTDPKDSPVYLKALELYFVLIGLTLKCVCGLRLPVNYKFAMDQWFEACAASSSIFNFCHLLWDRPARKM
jgi:hypothetical protein